MVFRLMEFGHPMLVACSSLGAAGVAAIYLIYGAYSDHLVRRWRRRLALRRRVAFLLWRTACHVEPC